MSMFWAFLVFAVIGTVQAGGGCNCTVNVWQKTGCVGGRTSGHTDIEVGYCYSNNNITRGTTVSFRMTSDCGFFELFPDSDDCTGMGTNYPLPTNAFSQCIPYEDGLNVELKCPEQTSTKPSPMNTCHCKSTTYSDMSCTNVTDTQIGFVPLERCVVANAGLSYKYIAGCAETEYYSNAYCRGFPQRQFNNGICRGERRNKCVRDSMIPTGPPPSPSAPPPSKPPSMPPPPPPSTPPPPPPSFSPTPPPSTPPSSPPASPPSGMCQFYTYHKKNCYGPATTTTVYKQTCTSISVGGDSRWVYVYGNSSPYRYVFFESQMHCINSVKPPTGPHYDTLTCENAGGDVSFFVSC